MAIYKITYPLGNTETITADKILISDGIITFANWGEDEDDALQPFLSFMPVPGTRVEIIDDLTGK